MGLNQTDKLSHSKENHYKKKKRTAYRWEKTISNNATNKSLKYTNNLYNSTAKKQTTQ